MRQLVLGTAGHIDHGKTTLTRALTGIDTDRLAEEKRRGISIELGFAQLTLPTGQRLAVVDVPGHERFVRNMLAGATGIDLVLLVVAADEGVMPQTREHFDICRLLGVKRGMVALTKCDLAGKERVAEVVAQVAALTHGSFLAGAPVLPVSAVTGAGMEALRTQLEQLAEDVREKFPLRAVEGYPRLPIDRVFTLKGHGTVVTGTLRDGALRMDSALSIYPSGKAAKVRSLQVHGAKVSAAEPGARVAVNLANVEVADLERGQVLATSGALRATSILDAEVEWLDTAPDWKDRLPVHFHAGAMETVAELRRTGETSGEDANFVRIVLAQETLILPGDRFILRSFSPVSTIGGGTVLDLHFPGTKAKRIGAAARLRQWATLTVAERSLSLAREQSLGLPVAALVARLGARPEEFSPQLVRIGADWVMAPESLARLAEAVEKRLAQHHAAKPLETGLAKEVLRRELLGEAPTGVLDAVLAQNARLVVQGEFLRLASHRVEMRGAEGAAATAIEAAFRTAGLAVPALEEVLASTRLPAAQAKAVLAVLLREGRLVRVSPELVFHRESIDKLGKLLLAKRGQSFSVPQFKEWTGVSRKYAIPLLEFLDRLRLTRRVGEGRVVN
ncbi:MAG: selenocysteine-specific translation elongation factor [Bryobacter sp.]|nr:selenocysteine-specific translation elongation factor [Bryobacter sp.]